jgi:hypothetical protein
MPTMDHPFFPLMLVGLIESERAGDVRDRQHLRAFRERQAVARPSIADRLRRIASPQPVVTVVGTECATCPA